MPLQADLDAITAMYVKLMDLPIKKLAPALKRAKVITDDQREDLKDFSKNRDQAAFLMDDVIIKSLRVDIPDLFINFLKVLDEDDDPVVKKLSGELRARAGRAGPTGPPMPVGPPPGAYMTRSPYAGYDIRPPPSVQPFGEPQRIAVEKFLMGSSKVGTDPVSAKNRNIHAVCLIKRKDEQGRTMCGSGFIAHMRIPSMPDKTSTVLVTNNHVIEDISAARASTFQFSYLHMESDITHVIDGQDLIPLNLAGFYTCKPMEGQLVKLDYTVIKVNERPINDITITSERDGERFSLSQCVFDLDNVASHAGTGQMETISISHYPKGGTLKRSTHRSVPVGYTLFYSCDTDEGSSGAPVFKVVDNKLQVIALHRGAWPDVKFNFGTLIIAVISDMRKQPPRWMRQDEVAHHLHNASK